jgi:hypothetical protein
MNPDPNPDSESGSGSVCREKNIMQINVDLDLKHSLFIEKSSLSSETKFLINICIINVLQNIVFIRINPH